VPETDDILAITSEAELDKEGRAQNNCVGGYAFVVKTGGYYVYRVLKPQRATLAIIRGPDGCWRRGDLKLHANAAPHPSTARHVDHWLSRHSLSV